MDGRILATNLAIGQDFRAGEVLVVLDAELERLFLQERRTRRGGLVVKLEVRRRQIVAEREVAATHHAARIDAAVDDPGWRPLATLDVVTRLVESLVRARGRAGRFDEAEALYRRALAVFEGVYGPDHYEIAVNQDNLGTLYQARGEPARAEACYRRALAIKEVLLGPEHPDVALTWHNLAVLLSPLGRHDEAEVCFRRALAIFRQALGSEHPKVLTCLESFARLLRDLERPKSVRKE